jgi:class 3 adenylate cyclase/CHASE2 domain-containing sensor protein
MVFKKLRKGKSVLAVMALAISFVLLLTTPFLMQTVNRVYQGLGWKELRLHSLVDPVENVLYDINWRIRLWFQDFQISQRSAVEYTETLEDQIVVVDIDDQTLSRLGSYQSWPRAYHAEVVNKLIEGQAAAVAFDILFKEADYGKLRTQQVLDAFDKSGLLNPADRGGDSLKLLQSLNDDQKLVDAIRRTDRVIVAATVGSTTNYWNQSELVKPLVASARFHRLNQASAQIGGWMPSQAFHMEILDDAFPALVEGPNLFALVNVIPDPDGVHRKEPLLWGLPNPSLSPGVPLRTYPVLALQTTLKLMNLKAQDLKMFPGRYLELGQPLEIHRNPDQSLGTSFAGLTGWMIEDVLQNAEALRQAYKDVSQKEGSGRVIELSKPMRLFRDSSGQVGADLFEAQTASSAFLDFLWSEQCPDSSLWFGRKAALDTVIGPYRLSWISEENMPLWSFDEAGEEVYLDPKTWSRLRSLKSLAQNLALGHDTVLSAMLQARVDTVRWRVSINTAILTPKTTKALLDHKDSIMSLQAGQSMRVGPILRIPVDDEGRMQLRYLGRFRSDDGRKVSIQTFSYADVLEGRIPPENFQGKVFILGSTAASLFDLVSSPTDEVYPGVMLHATMLSNMLNQEFMERNESLDIWWILLVLTFVGAMAGVYLRPWWALGVLGIGIVVVYGVQFWVFVEYDRHLGVLAQLGALLVSLVTGMAVKYFYEEREKRRTLQMFKQYLSPEMVDIMREQDTMPELGGVEDILTAYFTDIASFSTFSEKIGNPSKLVELLNEYLNPMTEILLSEKGTLDKYEGDAIIAFFGAPLRLENHAASACRTALAMQAKLKELRVYWSSQGEKWPEIVHHMRMRIGLNSGPIVTGNMGSTQRMNYTMMGDDVNLAARLESGAKQYGVFTMLSAATRQLAGDAFVCRKIDVLRVVGKMEPVTVYELLALREDVSVETLQLVDLFEKAWGLYEGQKWTEAIEIFQICLDLEPHHPDREKGCKTTPSHVFIRRCQDYQQHPPVPLGQVWDGVYEASEK